MGCFALPSPGSRLYALARQAYLVVLAALLAALYFGGWQVPGIAIEQADAHLGWSALGGGLYVLKTWGLLLLCLGGRCLLPNVRADIRLIANAPIAAGRMSAVTRMSKSPTRNNSR